MNINYLPMGLPAMAELLEREGYGTRILHLGIKEIIAPDFDLAHYLEKTSPMVVALSLHWHYQAYDAINVAKQIKIISPETFVVLGGFTASYFADGIMRDYPFIDAVVLGHADQPFLKLVETLKKAGDLGDVPNLLYRGSGGAVEKSRGIYCHTPEDIDQLVYANLDMLEDHDFYTDVFGFPFAYCKELSREENKLRQTMGRPYFPLLTGIGCPVKCTFCGGNRGTLSRITKSKPYIFRNPERVLEDIKRAKKYGYQTVSLCFDPTPQKDDYYVDLMKRIRDERVEIDFYFECWGLPTERFVKEFGRTFSSEYSTLAISPETGSERIRKLNKGYTYTNREIEDSLKVMADENVRADVFFSLALPYETIVEAMETRDFIRRITSRFNNLRRVMTWTIQIEPGSPAFEHPEAHGIESERSDFADFYEVHRTNRGDAYSDLGYKVKIFFKDDRDKGSIAEFQNELQHLKCMEFCFMSKDPRVYVNPELGRINCLERRRMLARKRGIVEPDKPIGENYRYADAVKDDLCMAPTGGKR